MENLIEKLEGRRHKIETKLGTFEFGWCDSAGGWWIYGVFDEPVKAKQVYDCNPYSGKYNFHGYWLGTPMEELMNFLHDLKQKDLLL